MGDRILDWLLIRLYRLRAVVQRCKDAADKKALEIQMAAVKARLDELERNR